MKSKCFREEKIKGLVEGRITQFREIIKPQPDSIFHGMPIIKSDNQIGAKDIKPRFKVGEICYIKEPYFIKKHLLREDVEYKYWYSQNPFKSSVMKWRNPITMAAHQARFFLEITAVRSENVCGISDEDCKKEGIICDGGGDSFRFYYEGSKLTYPTPKEAFAAQFNAINEKNAFENMVWVWVIDFKLLKQKP